MADDAALVALLGLILLQKFLRAGESHLRDVFFDLLGSHADAVIGHGERAGLLVGDHVHAVGIIRSLTRLDEQLVLGDGVAGVRDDLADENILVRIQPLLDDRHDILGVNRNSTFFHDQNLLILKLFHIVARRAAFVKYFLALNTREC